MKVTTPIILSAALAVASAGAYGIILWRKLATPAAPQSASESAASASNASATSAAGGGEKRFGAETDGPPIPVPEMGATLNPVSISEGLLAMGDWRGQPVLADLDGDGNRDIVTSVRRWSHDRPAEGLHVFLGDGKGRWRVSNAGLRRDMGYGGASVADVNHDGLLDIAFSGHDTPPQVFLGNGKGEWTVDSQGLEFDGVCGDVALGDLDGDGQTELVAIGAFPSQGGVHVFSRDPVGVWVKSAQLLDREPYGARVAIRDFDGCGRPEVFAITSAGPKVWKRDGETWRDLSTGLPEPPIGGSDYSLDLADLDGDGVQELLVAGMYYPEHDPLALYKYEGGAWKRWGRGLPHEEPTFDVKFGQVDGGGPPEIVAAGKFGIYVVTMPKPGEFSLLGHVAKTEGAFNVGVGDLNGDRRDDILFVGYGGVRALSLAGGGGGQ
jgi:hypothetical protein